MLDRFALKLVKPVVDAAARRLAARGVTADQVTLAGFALRHARGGADRRGPQPGSPSCRCSSTGRSTASTARWRGSPAPPSAAPSSTSRSTSCSTRRSRWPSRRWRPAQNALAAAVLLAAFIVTGTSFLAFAVMAEKRGLKSTAYPSKSFYYLGGLTEGTETIACFLAMCLWPAALRRTCLCLRRALRTDGGDAARRGLEDLRLKKFLPRGPKNPCM